LRVLIINTNREKSPQAVIPLGAHLVAEAARRAGHEVQFVDLCFSNRPLSTLQSVLHAQEFDVIGLSIRNLDNCDYCTPRSYLPAGRAIVETCRGHSQAKIVIGGSAVSQAPAAMAAYLSVDAAVVGEGELSFPALLQTFEAGTDPSAVPGVIGGESTNGMSRSPAPDLDSVSALCPALMENLSTYRAHDASWPLQTKRGCALQCSYCAYPNIEGKGWRLRDPEAVAEDLALAQRSGLPLAEFVDGVFGLPQAHAIACCEAAARANSAPGARPLPLCTMELNPAAVTPEFVDAMNAAGFSAVAITAESGSPAMLDSYGKNYSAETLHHAAQLLRGLRAHKLWIFLLGGPGETEHTVRETGKFLEALPSTDLVYVTHGVRVLPGTGLHERLIASGEIETTNDLLWPSFYHSPEVTPARSEKLLAECCFPSLNRVTASDGNSPLAGLVQRLITGCGLKPPYWRYLRQINRMRRMVRL
jgi:anaerobic magnesium-protoporphyrin IX monomethyl ester cyclase